MLTPAISAKKLFLQPHSCCMPHWSAQRAPAFSHFQSSAVCAQNHAEQECLLQEQGSSNPQALLQQLQASAQGSPRQQAMLIRMLQDSMLGAAAREPLAARVSPGIPNLWNASYCSHPLAACSMMCASTYAGFPCLLAKLSDACPLDWLHVYEYMSCLCRKVCLRLMSGGGLLTLLSEALTPRQHQAPRGMHRFCQNPRLEKLLLK